MFELQGWTIHRVAREAGVKPPTIRNWLAGRLIDPWAERRIRSALSYLGATTRKF